MTYAPHRSAPAAHRAPARRASPREDGVDVHPLRTRLWIAGGVAVSAALIAFGVWAVVTTPATVVVTVADPGDIPAADFGFEVTGLRCGVESIGPEGMAEKAAGQFCLVDLEVTNNGGEPKLFDSGAQRVQDTNGVAYAVADQAAVFLNEGSPSLLAEVEPGETVTGVLPFDVPSDVRLREATLTGAMSTPGVRVMLPDPR
ncbi:hypothetical protein Q0Z83_089420 [Actinoplanes sichuanensis]|uniref:DUF4352 domain-containing protein n=1 Tax=Actinoplanes sichuanensis TaxID=512349 RepID=A0ABW4A3T4_9ACTN|nr:DUF4352 domain-containing protein [Actinoplanes sichuanensis]BEL10751.1 hypothetical protein Q0Z83_089420 [Actinoplanes sichuanensis]